MNDRFKFRYFNKYANKMVEPENWQNVDAIYECIKQQVCFDEDIAPLPYNHIGNGLVFMQCTGLKDKNGKLIYEGDIVDKGTRCKWIITWFKNRFILVPDFEYKNKDKCAVDRECGFKHFENNHSYADKDDEVIGNIYENKSLLESEK